MSRSVERSYANAISLLSTSFNRIADNFAVTTCQPGWGPAYCESFIQAQYGELANLLVAPLGATSTWLSRQHPLACYIGAWNGAGKAWTAYRAAVLALKGAADLSPFRSSLKTANGLASSYIEDVASYFSTCHVG